MDIFKYFRTLRRHTSRPAYNAEPYVLDMWIREALLEESLARPLPSTWERLRKAITERRPRNYGMWILDEPLREPPAAPPSSLKEREFRRAQRLYTGDNAIYSRLGLRERFWSDLSPAFPAMVNL